MWVCTVQYTDGPLAQCAHKNLVETLNNVTNPTKCRQPLRGTPNGVLQFSMPPQGLFYAGIAHGGGVSSRLPSIVKGLTIPH